MLTNLPSRQAALTENDIHLFLKSIGINRNDTVLVHTSMRSLGEVEGGCDGLIDAFTSYLSDGLFLVPTHTWASVGAENPVYDVRTSMPCIGALPTVAAFRKDGIRSLHPTHSVAAFGKHAKEFVRGEERATSPCSDGGVWQRLQDEDAKILLIGVGLDRNTYIHAIDEMMNLTEKLAPPTRLTVVDYHGNKTETCFRAHTNTGSRFFENFRAPLERLGALKNAMLGNASVGVFYTRRATEIIKNIYALAEYNVLEDRKEIPEKYYAHLLNPEDKKAKIFHTGGSQYIREKIESAIADGSRRTTVTGCFEIDSEIRIPSDFTLILLDCHLRLKDGSYTNIFVNEHHGTDLGKTPLGKDRSISVIGVGEAVIDGGKYNDLSEKTQLKNGMPPVWKNNLILFTNVDGFRITGIHCRNQRWWALCFVYCSSGYLAHIDFLSSDLGIDENGREYHGLKQNKYSEILVKNADGIDLRQGCHDVLIEDITGFTEDDCIALTGIPWLLEEAFAPKGLPSDISNVEIRNVRCAAFCAGVRLLNRGGIDLHDILIDGVYDLSPDSPHMDKGGYAVRIGDTHAYGNTGSLESRTYNITVKNVRGGGMYALSLVGKIENLTLENIECFGTAELIQDQREN